MKGQELNRYRMMLSSLVCPPLRAVAHCDIQIDSVTLGIPAARLLIEDDPILYSDLVVGFNALARFAGEDAPMLSDSYGHRRDVYHFLVLHLHLAAFNKHYESISVSQWSACEDALTAATQSARQIESFAQQPPDAEHMAATLWRVLCLFETATIQSRDADIEWVDAVVHQIVQNPGEGGSLHPIESDESFDLWTYRELSGLHALANLALRQRNQSWAKRVQDIAEYHQATTQPDYTTTQPWGVFAFLWPTSTRLFADQQIHDAQTQGGGGLTPLAAMLLADAAHSLAAFAND